MKKNKCKILSLVMVALLSQNSFVYAADKEEDLDNITPSFEQQDIQKSNKRVNSFTNTFTGSQVKEDKKTEATPKVDKETANKLTPDNNQADPIVSTQESTGNRGDFWGLTQSGKWMLIERGNPVFGWKMVRGRWYYMNVNGIMQTGWLNYNGDWYYLMPSGAMASNTMVDGCWVNGDGVWN